MNLSTKITQLALFFLFFSCKTTNNLTIRIKPYLPKAIYRDALQLGIFSVNAKNAAFANALNLDTAMVFYRSFNDYQFLFNKWKRNEIDSINYVYSRLKLIREDSLALSNGYKISGLATYPDTTLDAEVKMFVGINKGAKNIFVIVDENNNKSFNDDRIVIIDTNNYKTIFDTLQFKVTNLSTFFKNAVISFQLPIMINQLSSSDKPKVFNELLNLNPWISASKYFKGKKRINGKRMYFDFSNFTYNYNDNTYSTIVSKFLINRGAIDNTIYEGDYLKINDLLWHIDSFNTRRVYLSIVKRTPSSSKLDLSIPAFK